MAEVIRQVRKPRLHGHAIGFEPLLSVGVVAQDGLGFRQHRVGGCDAVPVRRSRRWLTKPRRRSCSAGLGNCQLALQEEQALHGKTPGAVPAPAPARLARQYAGMQSP